MKQLHPLLFPQQSWLAYLSLLYFSLMGNSVSAQIIPDNTLPNNSLVAPNGDLIQIDGGTTAGANLFHSFQEFSLTTGNTAYFNNAVDIQNILTRVTGNNISDIDGLIKANGSANLFLINPNGIIFGENASLDIGGSFMGSTADSIVFSDGSEFSAVAPNSPPLLTVNLPVGLNLSEDAGEIIVKGSGNNIYYDWENYVPATGDRPIGFAVGSQKTLSLVGNGISLEGGNLTAQQGRVELGSINQAGIVNLTETDTGWALNYSNISNFGDINFTQAASVDASGNSGGIVQLTGKNITLNDGSVVLVETLGDGTGGLLNVQATDTVELFGENPDTYFWTSFLADTTMDSTGTGGDVVIKTNTLNLIDGGQITSVIYGTGDGGDIDVKAENINISGATPDGPSGLFVSAEWTASGTGGNINVETTNLDLTLEGQIAAFTWGEGDAGNIKIDAKQISITDFVDFVAIAANAEEFSFGNAGNVEITVEDLYLADGGQISATTFGDGNAGIVKIDANNLELVGSTDPTESYRTGIFSAAGFDILGNAGIIEITANNFDISNGAQIQTTTFGLGNGGSILINAENLSLQGFNAAGKSAILASAIEGTGNGGDLNIITDNLSIQDGATISVSNFSTRNPDFAPGAGKAGDIKIQAQSLELNSTLADESSSITASTYAAGGGNIVINAESINALNNTEISADTQGEGKGGSIQVNTETLDLKNGAIFSSSTSDAGDAGTIKVEGQNIELKGKNTGIFSQAQVDSSGNGGLISLTGENIKLRDRSTLNSTTDGTGDGGTIKVNSNSLQIFSQAEITTSSTGLGQAGNIELNSERIQVNRGSVTATSEQTGGGDLKIDTEFLQLQNNSLISTSVLDSNGGGGNISINSDQILASNNSDIRANAVTGPGGNITIFTEVIFTSPNSEIDASSQFGIDGVVEITNPNTDRQLTFTELPDTMADSTQLIAATCPVSNENAMVVSGKGGLAENPKSYLVGQSVWHDTRLISPSGNSTASEPIPSKPKNNQILEAKGWMVDAEGNLELVSDLAIAENRNSWYNLTTCKDL